MIATYSTPTLVLDEHICRSNIKQMADKARKHDLMFKPHMKTHQSAPIGEWLRTEGVTSITVSSVKMARYFAENGWGDITIAFPVNVRQNKDIDALAGIVSLTVLVNNIAAVRKLDAELSNPVKAYIEIDTGSNRTGLQVTQSQQIQDLIQSIRQSGQLEWIGFYSHPGHSYAARSEKEILSSYQEVLQQVQHLRNSYLDHSGSFDICIGDTPCCSVATSFEGIDSISPGNFIFYDVMQSNIGSCGISDIAVAVECPIVDRYPGRNELAIYGGAIHFSKESYSNEQRTHFGLPASKRNNKWRLLHRNCYVRKISQEHGIITCPEDVFQNYQIGDIIAILPVHSCLTAHLLGEYALAGSGEMLEHLSSLRTV